MTLSLAAFLALASLAAQHHWFDLDHSVRQLIRFTRHPMLDTPMWGFSLLGEQLGLIPLIALTSAALWPGHRCWALALPLIMAGTGGLQLLAKWAVDRPRPNLAAWGFPSGHVLALVVFFGIIAYLLCTVRAGWGWGRVGAGAAGITVLIVAFSRLYLDVHWLSDVAGGLALGVAYLLLTIWLVESISRRAVR
ncbi:MAG: phosphatase PAP2 family protein [Candidatus Rokuibacteriota bacterium]